MHKPLLLCLLPASLLLIISCGSGGDDSPPAEATTDPEGSQAASDEGVDAINNLLDGFASNPGATSESLALAHSSFSEAVALDPSNGTAQVFLAGTTLTTFFEEGNASITQSTLGGLLDDFGFGAAGRSLSDIASGSGPTFPTENITSDSPNLGRVQNWITDELFLQQMDIAASHLEAVAPSFSDTITISGVLFEVDYADAQLFAASLRLVQAIALIPMAFDFDMNLGSINKDYHVHTTSSGVSIYVPYRLYSPAIQTMTDGWAIDGAGDYYRTSGGVRSSLIAAPEAQAENFWDTVWQMGDLPSSDRMYLAKSRLHTAINNVIAGLNYLLSESPDQKLNGIFSIPDEPLIRHQAELCLLWLDPIPAALEASASTTIPAVYDAVSQIDLPSLTMDPRYFASATYSNRPFLPDYSLGADFGDQGELLAIVGAFPDPTLNGVFPDFTEEGLLGFYQAINELFEYYMNSWSQVHKSYPNAKERGNWMYASPNGSADNAQENYWWRWW